MYELEAERRQALGILWRELVGLHTNCSADRPPPSTGVFLCSRRSLLPAAALCPAARKLPPPRAFRVPACRAPPALPSDAPEEAPPWVRPGSLAPAPSASASPRDAVPGLSPGT
ncbi:classical arabinogalactan protein 7-like [Sus scrofa]|uniref:classical arabinogalactan protein 7-like n=1 Tax=Sus scrofa TaxID=9823 RepID=UPI000A2AFE6A|nr:classical arabinogalactan protein 7-like [Sus scrofa]